MSHIENQSNIAPEVAIRKKQWQWQFVCIRHHRCKHSPEVVWAYRWDRTTPMRMPPRTNNLSDKTEIRTHKSGHTLVIGTVYYLKVWKIRAKGKINKQHITKKAQKLFEEASPIEIEIAVI